MEIQIRKAIKKDFKAVNALFKKLHQHEYEQFGMVLNLKWTDTKSGQNFIKKHFEDPQSIVFVAVKNKELAGYVFGGKIPTSRAWKNVKQFRLANIYVEEQYRNTGIGRQLMETFIAWAKKNGAEKIKLHAFSDNKTAIRLYKKQGFKDSVTTMVLDI